MASRRFASAVAMPWRLPWNDSGEAVWRNVGGACIVSGGGSTVSTTKDSQGRGGAAMAWSGEDPIAYTRAVAALEDAGIKVFDIAENDQFMGVPQISGPRYRVLIAQSDAAQAQKVLREAFNDEGEQK